MSYLKVIVLCSFVLLGCTLPCHTCYEGEVLMGLNYSFGDLGLGDCSLPTTTNCSVCVILSGEVVFPQTTVRFTTYMGCGPGCDQLVPLSRQLLGPGPNTTVLSQSCTIRDECLGAFCNSASFRPGLAIHILLMLNLAQYCLNVY